MAYIGGWVSPDRHLSLVIRWHLDLSRGTCPSDDDLSCRGDSRLVPLTAAGARVTMRNIVMHVMTALDLFTGGRFKLAPRADESQPPGGCSSAYSSCRRRWPFQDCLRGEAVDHQTGSREPDGWLSLLIPSENSWERDESNASMCHCRRRHHRDFDIVDSLAAARAPTSS